MNFEEYLKITKIREILLESNSENIIFEGTMEDYLENVSDTNFELNLFKLFYTGKFLSIKLENIYGNFHKYQLIWNTRM